MGEDTEQVGSEGAVYRLAKVNGLGTLGTQHHTRVVLRDFVEDRERPSPQTHAIQHRESAETFGSKIRG